LAYFPADISENDVEHLLKRQGALKEHRLNSITLNHIKNEKKERRHNAFAVRHYRITAGMRTYKYTSFCLNMPPTV
jgi:hypothetical protein